MGAECDRCGKDIYDGCDYCDVKDDRDRLRAALEAIGQESDSNLMKCMVLDALDTQERQED